MAVSGLVMVCKNDRAVIRAFFVVLITTHRHLLEFDLEMHLLISVLSSHLRKQPLPVYQSSLCDCGEGELWLPVSVE